LGKQKIEFRVRPNEEEEKRKIKKAEIKNGVKKRN